MALSFSNLLWGVDVQRAFDLLDGAFDDDATVSLHRLED